MKYKLGNVLQYMYVQNANQINIGKKSLFAVYINSRIYYLEATQLIKSLFKTQVCSFIHIFLYIFRKNLNEI